MTEQETSYYDLLEVRGDAAPEEIKAAFEKISAHLAAQELVTYTMIDDGQSHEYKTKVEQAYSTLSDPVRRAAYDRQMGFNTTTYPTLVVQETAARQLVDGEPV